MRKNDLPLYVIRYSEDDYTSQKFSHKVLVRSKEDLLQVDLEILWEQYFKEDDDETFCPEDHCVEVAEILIKETPILTGHEIKEIEDKIYHRAAKILCEDLELDDSSDEVYDPIYNWLRKKYKSLDDLRCGFHAVDYEIHIVSTTPAEDLPLMINNLKSDGGKRKLEERLQSGGK